MGSLEPIPTDHRVKLGLHPGKVIISSRGKHANFTQKGWESELNLLAAQATAAPRRPFDSHCNYLSQKRLERRKIERKMCSQRSMLGKLGSLCVLFSDCASPLYLSPVLTRGKPHCFHTSHLKLTGASTFRKLCHSVTFAVLLV